MCVPQIINLLFLWTKRRKLYLHCDMSAICLSGVLTLIDCDISLSTCHVHSLSLILGSVLVLFLWSYPSFISKVSFYYLPSSLQKCRSLIVLPALETWSCRCVTDSGVLVSRLCGLTGIIWPVYSCCFSITSHFTTHGTH